MRVVTRILKRIYVVKPLVDWRTSIAMTMRMGMEDGGSGERSEKWVYIAINPILPRPRISAIVHVTGC